MTQAKTYVPDCISNLQYRRHEKERKFSPKIKFFWQLLVHEMGDDDQLTCEVKEWAEKYFNVSSQTVRNWLQFFEDRKLIKITGGGRGRGRKWVIKFSSWVRKKIELAAKGVRSTTKERLNELEAEYLKSVSWTEKNTKNPNKVYKNPKSKNNHTLTTGGETAFHQKASLKGKKLTTEKERREHLKHLGDDIVIYKYSRYYRYVMEQFRRMVWLHGGFSKGEGKIVCNAVGKLINGKELGWIRSLFCRLRDNAQKVRKALRKCLKEGLREGYRIVNWFLRKGLDKLKRKESDHYPKAVREAAEALAVASEPKRRESPHVRQIRKMIERHGVRKTAEFCNCGYLKKAFHQLLASGEAANLTRKKGGSIL